MSTVVKYTILMSATQAPARRYVNFRVASGAVVGRTYTGLLQESITCVG